MKKAVFIAFFALLCCSVFAQGWPSLSLKTVEKNTVNITQLEQQKAIILVWLSPECPLCRNYSLPLRKLQKTLNSDSIKLVGVVAGTDFKRKEILAFKKKYKIDFEILLDEEYALTQYFNATVTPEALLVNQTGEVLYQGAIDNWAVALGKQRRKATEHYLLEALAQFKSNTVISQPKTEPIGCFIYAFEENK